MTSCPHCGVPLTGMNSNPDDCLHKPLDALRENVRLEMMRRFSEKLTMDEIANFAYALAAHAEAAPASRVPLRDKNTKSLSETVREMEAAPTRLEPDGVDYDIAGNEVVVNRVVTEAAPRPGLREAMNLEEFDECMKGYDSAFSSRRVILDRINSWFTQHTSQPQDAREAQLFAEIDKIYAVIEKRRASLKGAR